MKNFGASALAGSVLVRMMGMNLGLGADAAKKKR